MSKFSGAPALLVNTTSISSKADKTSLLQFNIAIHPNPVKAQMLTLQIQHTKYANLQLGIYNLEGEIVLSQQFDVTQSTTKQININKLSAGTYVIRLSDGEEVRSVMFIKE
ncbi:MAG TPA: T9SS type A sorting domain-containing protein [Flavisolibacter sp.]|nr:T9SS type A sorting domain-containing protein [Flavisolibacter sp.]